MSRSEIECGEWSPFHVAGSRFVRVRTYGNSSLSFEVWRQFNGHDEEPEIVGWIRFDGCVNMNTQCIHTCRPDEMLDIAKAVEWVHVQAARMIDGYCGAKVEPFELPVSTEQT